MYFVVTASSIKLRLHGQFLARDGNVIFRNYCNAIAREKCNPAPPCAGKISGHSLADRKLPEYSEFPHAMLR